jgi:hypothetical protein
MGQYHALPKRNGLEKTGRANAAATGVGGDSGKRPQQQEQDLKVCVVAPLGSSFASSLNHSSPSCFPQAFPLTRSRLQSTPPPATMLRSPAGPEMAAYSYLHIRPPALRGLLLCPKPLLVNLQVSFRFDPLVWF